MVYVITGGPGFGKTTIVNRLAEIGFLTGDEVARSVIGKQEGGSGDDVFWDGVAGLQGLVLSARVSFLKSIPFGTVAFSDRGVPDQVAFSNYKGKVVDPVLMEACKKNRYAGRVFITPPWSEIYQVDLIRRESFEEACKIHSCIVSTYQSLGYTLVSLPLLSVAERVKFIMSEIGVERKSP